MKDDLINKTKFCLPQLEQARSAQVHFVKMVIESWRDWQLQAGWKPAV